MLLTELERFIDEDSGYNDISSSVVPDCRAQAEVIAREDGVVADIAEATQVFEYFDILSTTDLTDGSSVKKNDVLFILDGGAGSIM